MILKNIVLFPIPVTVAILYLQFSTFDKKLYVSTFIFLLGIIVLQKLFYAKSKKENFDTTFNEKIIKFIILIFLILTQNRYLNIETITWDVSSYLVAANEINLGYIPFEMQWESKGPLAIYIYYFLSLLGGDNYVYFKLLNDFILFLSIIIFIASAKKYKSSQMQVIFSALLLTSIFSIQWFVSEFTEFYCLPLIAFANYLYSKENFNYQKYVGFLFGLSFMINQGSVLFFLPILINNFLASYKNKKLIKIIAANYIFGFCIPVFCFVFIYWKNNLLDVLIANYFDIPLGYVGENASSFYELRVFLREIATLNIFTYFSLITIIFFFIINSLKKHNLKLFKLFELINLNIIFSLLYYFIAGHNFYHHLIYLIFFSTFLIFNISENFQLNLIFVLIFLSSIISIYESLPSSYVNLSNLEKTYNDYPLKNLADEIDKNFDNKNYSILALDFVIILDYLDKTNYSYIVHPTNHYQNYISDVLIQLDKIEENNIIKLIDEKPDVIICNKRSIDNGGRVMSADPNTYGNDIKEGIIHFCDYENLKKDYFQIDTELFRINPNLNYYFDPYKEMNVFIKKN